MNTQFIERETNICNPMAYQTSEGGQKSMVDQCIEYCQRAKYLMLILGLNKTVDQLAMAKSVYCQGHVLRRQDGYVMKRALEFEVEGQKKKRTWKKQVEEESIKVSLSRQDALC